MSPVNPRSVTSGRGHFIDDLLNGVCIAVNAPVMGRSPQVRKRIMRLLNGLILHAVSPRWDALEMKVPSLSMTSLSCAKQSLGSGMFSSRMYCQTSISVQLEMGKPGSVRLYVFAVEQVPEFRTLFFGSQLAELITVTEKPFFGTGFFFIAFAGTTMAEHQTYVLLLFPAGLRLHGTLRLALILFLSTAAGDTVSMPTINVCTHLIHEPVAILDGFREVVSGINVTSGKGCGPARMLFVPGTP